jgi:hypothetical protein
MSNAAGIWIDHRKAVIVTLTPAGESVATIESGVEKHPERGGDSPLKGPYEARQVPADDSRQRALTNDLARYYDSVIAAVSTHDNLLIFGPGEAKGELHKRLGKVRPQAQVAAVETADKMTDGQIAAKVRDFF